MNEKSTRMGYPMLLPSVILILVLILYPTVNTIYQSFFEIRTQTAALGPKFVGFRNYVKAFQDEHFWDTLWWTLAFTAVSVALELIIGMGLALLMNRKIPGQGLIRTAVLIPWGIPMPEMGPWFGRSRVISRESGDWKGTAFFIGRAETPLSLGRMVPFATKAVRCRWESCWRM